MSQKRATPYHLGTNTLAIPVQEPICTMPHAVLYVQQRARMDPGGLTISSEPSTSSFWNAEGSRGRMEACMGHVLHPCRSFPPAGRMSVVQEGNKNSNGGVGNGRADGQLPSRRD
jgi:hypothetical protein